MANNSQSGISIGFPGLLTLIFVIAKLAGYFPYSWWIVFIPLYIAIAIWLFLAFIIVVLAVIKVMYEKK